MPNEAYFKNTRRSSDSVFVNCGWVVQLSGDFVIVQRLLTFVESTSGVSNMTEYLRDVDGRNDLKQEADLTNKAIDDVSWTRWTNDGVEVLHGFESVSVSPTASSSGPADADAELVEQLETASWPRASAGKRRVKKFSNFSSEDESSSDNIDEPSVDVANLGVHEDGRHFRKKGRHGRKEKQKQMSETDEGTSQSSEDKKSSCAELVCLRGGQCVADALRRTGVRCQCPLGTRGNTCEQSKHGWMDGWTLEWMDRQ